MVGHVTALLVITILSLGVVINGVEMEAEFSMNNIQATITLSSEGRITTSFRSGWQEGLLWGIHGYPFVYATTADVCSNQNIGTFLPLTPVLGSPPENGTVVFPDPTVFQLLGVNGTAGRSLVISDGVTRACANIQRPGGAPVKLATATILGSISGTVEFRDIGPRHVTVFVDLFQTVPYPSETFRLVIRERDNMVCKNGAPLKVLGSVTPGLHKGSSRALLIETSLPFSLIAHSSLSLLRQSGEMFACEKIRAIAPKTVTSVVNMRNVSGSFQFYQHSPYEPTIVSFHLEGLRGILSGYHIHEFPLPYRFTADSNVCDVAAVSGHYNPLGAIIPTPAGSITEDKFEIGDLSGKYGTLAGLVSVSRTGIRDWSLPLFGRLSIVGRSIVLHLTAGGFRFACVDIGYPGVTRVVQASFVGDVIGRVVLTQEVNDPWADTSVFVELGHTRGVTEITTGHKLSVTEDGVRGDQVSNRERCASAGIWFNPFRVSSSSADYMKYCSPSNPLRCEAGDLSGKSSRVSVAPDLSPLARAFYTDISTSLQGTYSIVGRAIVLFAADGSHKRLACGTATVYQDPPARVIQWVSTVIPDNPTPDFGRLFIVGSNVATFSSVFVTLRNLATITGGYHIHEHPIAGDDSPAATAGACSVDSIGGHFNPLDITGSPALGTHDQYEIGDFSGKFGSLVGLGAKFAVFRDTNLPTRGANSVTGRSVALHLANDGSRYACGDVELILSPSVRKIQAMATFTGDIVGTVKFTNYIYNDGSTLDTTITVELYYANDSSRVTTMHNWHVHETTVSEGDCYSTGPHYNPYGAPASEPRYSTLCSRSNPLYCELGDLSGKHGRYNIGAGRKTFTDISLPLEGQFSIIGRAVTFHVEGGGGPRIACADILPIGGFSFIHSFPSPVIYSRERFLSRIAALWPGTDLAVFPTSPRPSTDNPCCQDITVYLPGMKFSRIFKALVVGRDDLGEYSSYRCAPQDGGEETCTAGDGFEIVRGTDRRFYAQISGQQTIIAVRECPDDSQFLTSTCACSSIPPAAKGD